MFGAAVTLWFLLTISGSQPDNYQQAQATMIEQIQADAARTAAFTQHPQISEEVVNALLNVPRHAFVPAVMEPFAYLNKPLPIGYEQTISQPFIVALMTDLVHPSAEDTALEIGTGSGYQAAVLSELVQHVHSVEIIAELAEEARARLQAQGYKNVSVHLADGYQGWPNGAPYDVILVTAAIAEVPRALIEQLRPGGRLILPLGEPDEGQELVLIIKTSDGKLEPRPVLPVRFVPFTGPHTQ